MKTPRVQSLLAALVLLASSSWSSGADAGKNAPAAKPALPTWQAKEEPSADWLTVAFTDPKTKKGTVVYCRRSDCLGANKTGQAPLYRLEATKTETVPTDVKVPHFKTVLGRTFTWTTTEKGTMDKVFYDCELSNYTYDLASKEVSKGSFRQKFAIYDPKAKHDEPSFEAMPRLMVVSAPKKVSNDHVAGSPQSKPGAPAKPGAPLKPGVPAPVASDEQALLPAEILWLTFPERDDAKTTPAAKRKQVADNLRPMEKEGYTKLAASPKDAAAYLSGLKSYGEGPDGKDEIELSAADQKLLDAAKLQEYKERMSLEVRKEAGKSDLVMAHRITMEYRKPLPRKEPGGSTGAAQDLKPLTDEELKNLTEAERVAYKTRLEQVQAKLEDAKKKKDPAGVAAANEELGALVAEYRKKAADGLLTAIPRSVDELNALTKPQQTKFCKDLMAAPEDGFIGGFQVITGAKDQLATAATANAKANSIIGGQVEKGAAAVSANPPPQIAKTEADKIRARCKEMMAALPATSGGGSVNLTVKDPGLDCDKDKDGKCKAPEGKKDPNEWLAVKSGAAGAIVGVMVGSFFGPVGIIVGAAIAFGFFWGLTKLNN